MIYDRDLSTARLIFAGMALGNIAGTVINAFRGHWLIAVTSLIWAFTCLWFVIFLRYQQQMRDALRVAQAGIRALTERQER
jgi:hypothetical protein